jgi:integrase/recombinase XerC
MMPSPLLPVPLPHAGQLDPTSAADRLLQAWLSGRSPETARAYKADLESFRTFSGAADVGQAAARLLAGGQGPANGVALTYRSSMVDRGLAPATINRRLAALRSVIQVANLLGLVPWKLEVENIRSETYRDTRGPGKDGFRRMLAVLAGRTDAKGVRDLAAVRLLFDLALRRIEVTRLDLEDFDRERGAVAVLGKGRTQKVSLTMPAPTRAALEAWIRDRGDTPGPLFTPLDRARRSRQGAGRLTGNGLYQIVRELGRRAGLKTWPHGLRHSAITEALDATGGNIRAVQKFSRHKDVRVIERYDDNREDMAGDVARRVAESAQAH